MTVAVTAVAMTLAVETFKTKVSNYVAIIAKPEFVGAQSSFHVDGHARGQLYGRTSALIKLHVTG